MDTPAPVAYPHVQLLGGEVVETPVYLLGTMSIYVHEVNIARHGGGAWNDYDDDEATRGIVRDTCAPLYERARTAYVRHDQRTAIYLLGQISRLSGSYGLGSCRDAWADLEPKAARLAAEADARARAVQAANEAAWKAAR